MRNEKVKIFLRFWAVLLISAISAAAQTTAFNYQGKLTDTGVPQATYQMQFRLFDAVSGGSQIGSTINNASVAVTDGVFSVKLDFGTNAFSGADRFLEIGVRRSSNDGYTILNPRQQIASSPYSIRTLSAQQADLALNSNQLGGIAANEYITNATGGSSFIRNSTTQQTANFNISGNAQIGGLTGFNTVPNPNFRVDSFGSIRSYNSANANFVAETMGGTNAWARSYWRSPSRSWFMGTSQNFNGNQLYIADETAGQTRMVITTDGSVGIGTTNPGAGLELRGTGLQTQQRITDNTSGNSLVLQGGAGGNMKITGYNYTTNTAVPLYLSTDGANTVMNSGGGNVLQPGAGYGLPKAMVFVLANGVISRCYNGVTGVSMTGGTTGSGCGFATSILQADGPKYGVNFGFSVSSRFASLTSFGWTVAQQSMISGRITSMSGNSVGIYLFENDATTLTVASDFFLIIY